MLVIGAQMGRMLLLLVNKSTFGLSFAIEISGALCVMAVKKPQLAVAEGNIDQGRGVKA